MKDVTIIIKTFERPEYVRRLIKSIRQFYPEIDVLVADDSQTPTPQKGVDYYSLPFDVGVSAGRNYLVDRVKTKYFITVDDDWVFTAETKIENFVKLMETREVDILVGSYVSHPSICVNFDLSDGVLTAISVSRDQQNDEFQYCEYTNQFFIADTEEFKKFGSWDEILKTRGEHLELFLRAKMKGLKVALTRTVRIVHERGIQGGTKYKTYRSRDYFGLAMKKHGVTKFINYNGKERKFTDKEPK
jgi:GT2 family glycosyltransferase